MMNTATRPTFTIKVNPELMDIKWGDVVFVDFTDNSRDSEQSGIRPQSFFRMIKVMNILLQQS